MCGQICKTAMRLLLQTVTQPSKTVYDAT